MIAYVCYGAISTSRYLLINSPLLSVKFFVLESCFSPCFPYIGNLSLLTIERYFVWSLWDMTFLFFLFRVFLSGKHNSFDFRNTYSLSFIITIHLSSTDAIIFLSLFSYLEKMLFRFILGKIPSLIFIPCFLILERYSILS